MSSYFQSIRRLKDAQFYINEITRQFAVWKATQDQVDNPQFKSYQRATTNRLICKEQAAVPVKKPASEWQPQIPQEPDGGVLTPPSQASISLWINFDHELEDRSQWNNDGIFEFTNNQPQFIEGPEDTLNFALDFNHNSNATFDKIWVPFSNSTQIVYDTPSGFSIFTRIKPWIISDLGTPTMPGPTPRTNLIQTSGGTNLNKYAPEIVNIYWGSAWTSGSRATRRTHLNQAIDQVCASDHYKILWQYGGIKPPSGRSPTHGNVHRNTSVPSEVTTNEAWIELNAMVDAGVIPNPENFAEIVTDAANGTFKMDFRHIYVLHIPDASALIGNGGFACWFAVTGGTHAQYMVIPYGTATFENWNALQMNEQGLFHEMCHCLEGACHGAYESTQHPQPENNVECGKRLRTLQGTDVDGRPVLTESMWSDMDGGCVAAGSGDNWTRPPAAGTPTNPNIRRYIFQKLDDLDNGATAAIGPDGTLYFSVKKAGTEYKIKTVPGAIKVNEWHDLWFGFDYATNAPRIFVNAVFYNQSSTEALLWNNTHSHFIIGNYNLGGATGQMRAAMDDFRLYRNSVVSSDQVENLANNGLTISNIEPNAEVSVAVVNRVRIGKPLQNTGVFVSADAEAGDVAAAKTSFSTDSFTSTSFTIL